jgi:hypothetical protein
VRALGNDYVVWMRLSSAESVVRRRSRDAGRSQRICRFLSGAHIASRRSNVRFVSCFIAVFVALPLVAAMLFCDVRAAPASSPLAAGFSVTKVSHGRIDHSFESEPSYDKASARAAHLAA